MMIRDSAGDHVFKYTEVYIKKSPANFTAGAFPWFRSLSL